VLLEAERLLAGVQQVIGDASLHIASLAAPGALVSLESLELCMGEGGTLVARETRVQAKAGDVGYC
jgi:hypothetical protein